MTRDPGILEQLDDAGRTPKLALGVEVERCFLQCGKALKRSKLLAARVLARPRRAAQRGPHLQRPHRLEGITEEAAEEHLRHSYATELWPS